MKMETSVTRNLLKWYRMEKRDFLWRRTSNPYKILICELLLKKTKAETVNKWAPIFLSKFPDLESISNSTKRKLRHTIKPFGLYKQRADQIHKLALYLKRNHNNRIPRTLKALLSTPGIGHYTANAVMCFAYGKKVPIIDTNTARIFSRIYDIECERGELRRDRNLLSAIHNFYKNISTKKIKSLNWALLDFGALICKARNPLCDECPILSNCTYIK